jgi:hypothetical protein
VHSICLKPIASLTVPTNSGREDDDDSGRGGDDVPGREDDDPKDDVKDLAAGQVHASRLLCVSRPVGSLRMKKIRCKRCLK